MTKKLLFIVLFGPEESLDPASLRMKTDKPSQSYRNITERCSINFYPQSFHQTITCGFVLRPTWQWLVCMCFVICLCSRWFLMLVMSHVPRLLGLTAPDFFLWGYLKSKVYIRWLVGLNVLKQVIWEEFINISEETLQKVLRNFTAHVRLCVQEGGGHLKDIVRK
jgi:hypothetical protein